jgi:hypothetical protein
LRKNYPLRIDAEVLDSVRRWADDDLRSLNGQIEYLLRDALRRVGRLNRGLQEVPKVTEEDAPDGKPE